MRRIAWLVLLAAGLPSCRTAIVVADMDSGYQADGDRYLQLRYRTLKLDQVEVAADEPRAPRIELWLAAGARRSWQFKLPFQAWNGTDTSWELRTDMFALALASDDRGTAAGRLQPVVLATVPPRSSARFELLARIHHDGEPHVAPTATLELTVRDAETLLLRRKLFIDSFDQTSQLARFVGFGVLTLLLVGLLP